MRERFSDEVDHTSPGQRKQQRINAPQNGQLEFDFDAAEISSRGIPAHALLQPPFQLHQAFKRGGAVTDLVENDS